MAATTLPSRICWAAAEGNWRTFRGYFPCCDERPNISRRLQWQRVASVRARYVHIRQTWHTVFSTIPTYAIPRYVPEYDGPEHGPDLPHRGA